MQGAGWLIEVVENKLQVRHMGKKSVEIQKQQGTHSTHNFNCDKIICQNSGVERFT